MKDGEKDGCIRWILKRCLRDGIRWRALFKRWLAKRSKTAHMIPERKDVRRERGVEERDKSR